VPRRLRRQAAVHRAQLREAGVPRSFYLPSIYVLFLFCPCFTQRSTHAPHHLDGTVAGTSAPTASGRGTSRPSARCRGASSPTAPGRGTSRPTARGRGASAPTAPGRGTSRPSRPSARGRGASAPTAPGRGASRQTARSRATLPPTAERSAKPGRAAKPDRDAARRNVEPAEAERHLDRHGEPDRPEAGRTWSSGGGGAWGDRMRIQRNCQG
jgi:hypothetical protein